MPAQFSGDPTTVWIADPSDDDRKMRLAEEFWFEDRGHKKWVTPAGYAVDGASIPRALWTLVGSPYTGRYRRASIVHDKACDDAIGKPAERRAADRMFFEACRAGGCNPIQAAILYAGVRVGGMWSQLQPEMLRSDSVEGPTITRPIQDRAIVADYQYMADRITREGETDDPFELERRADAVEATLQPLRAAAFSGI